MNVNRWMWGLVIASMAIALPVSAAKPIYRCEKDKQIILTDRPCDAPANAAGAGTPASANGEVTKSISELPTVVGNWRGQTQFQGTENGQLLQEAHTVVGLTLTFIADGKVSGTSPDNGCSVLGVWSPGIMPRLLPLDITLKDCLYAGFNRRYSGNLLATFGENSAQLTLQAYTVPIPGVPLRRYDVSATLRGTPSLRSIGTVAGRDSSGSVGVASESALLMSVTRSSMLRSP